MLGAVLVAILGFLSGVWAAGYDSEGTFQGDTMVIYGDGSSPPEGTHNSDGDGWSDHGSEERGGGDSGNGNGYNGDGGSSRKENGGRRRGRTSISNRLKSRDMFEYSDKSGPHGKGPYQGGSFDPRLAWYSADKRAKIGEMQARREKYIKGGGLYWALMLRNEIEKLEAELKAEEKASVEETLRRNEESLARRQAELPELIRNTEFSTYEPQGGAAAIFHLVDRRNDALAGIKDEAIKSKDHHDLLIQQVNAILTADIFIENADKAYSKDNEEEAEMSMDIANALIDITTSLTPGISWGRDIYEAISGHDLISGETIGSIARGAAVFGALTGGFGSKIVKGKRILDRILLKIDIIKKSPQWKKLVGRAEKAPAIQLPRSGKAVQEMGDDVLMARLQVEKGATLYRTGESGVQHTNKAQYWSLENPLEVKDYASKYGMPPGDLKKYDFVETAVLKRDEETGKLADFITRKAPAIKTNPGGNIEVVVNPGDVIMQTYHTIEKGSIK